MKKGLLFFCFLWALPCMAQLPETTVYLFDLQKSGKTYQVNKPQIISKRIGYNNQPYFSPDGNYLFYVSSMDTSNTEIFRYDLRKKKSKRITKTKEPEYSPRYTPDMSRLSCVRVEKDKTTQHFYTYNLAGKKPINILPDLVSIGYYDWISHNEFLSFELPEPFYLVRHNIQSNKKDTIAQNIGRNFYYARNKNKIIYVDKSDSTNWKIRLIATENLKPNKKTAIKLENPILTETLPNEEDYCLMQDGSILMGHEGKLFYKKNPFRFPNSTWEEWIDLHSFGISSFYRIAISADNTKLALVTYSGKKP